MFRATPSSYFSAMELNPTTWTKDQYHAFLLICGAHSNFSVTDREHLYISTMLGEDNYRFAEAAWKACSDFQCLEILQAGRKIFYPSDHDKMQLESELKTLFAADHDYAILEENFMRYLHKVL